ncbi:type II toxin-antitoxin system RelB family antitoxin [Corticicoccus populi]|uniref:Type II toxin-antitoxin system RelB family antitoxin n=1 Tax=Corticicoccus populi TaxID=1812821 RepID=A0ABW5WT52_9STAP
MTTTTIRIPQEDYKKVESLAAFEGVSVSEFMRKAVMEQVEDTLDYEEGISILSEHNERVSR